MRWIRSWSGAVGLVTVVIAAVGAGAMGFTRSVVRSGATYEGRGLQPHFFFKGPNAPSGRFIVQFRVTRDGRRIRELHVWDLDVACGRGRLLQPSLAVGSAAIRRDATFRVDLRDTISGAGGAALTVAGRFLSQGRASGTVRYRGQRDYKGCNADGVWTTHIKPPPPPVQHFIGVTEQGTRVSFERTIERNPRVMRFDFGLLRASYPGPARSNCGPVKVATGRMFVPPYSEFALAVRQRRFSGRYFPGGGFTVVVSGRFDVKDRASGTVSYNDRGDCATGTVHWTAHRQTKNR